MVETRSIDENNIASVTIDTKILDGRRTGVQIMANSGQCFCYGRVDELGFALNAMFSQKVNNGRCFFPLLPLPLD
jgi:methyl coenzyme M reductase gamma subunit